MKREALIREVRKRAKDAGVEFRVEENAGKGSHYRIHYGSKFTTLKSGEMNPTYVKLIMKQLGIE